MVDQNYNPAWQYLFFGYPDGINPGHAGNTSGQVATITGQYIGEWLLRDGYVYFYPDRYPDTHLTTRPDNELLSSRPFEDIGYLVIKLREWETSGHPLPELASYKEAHRNV